MSTPTTNAIKELERAIRMAAESEDVSQIVIVRRLIAYLKGKK